MRIRGFTLLELLLALTLLGLVIAVMFGSLRLSARSWDMGEERTDTVNQMRTASQFLRLQLSQTYPLRWRKIQNSPLAFNGQNDRMRFSAPLLSRVGQGGIFWLELSLEETQDNKKRLLLKRLNPDRNATTVPEFNDAEITVLAEGLSEMKISYYGRDDNRTDTVEPTWRELWEAKQELPQLIKIQIKSANGSVWPELVAQPKLSTQAGCVWDSFHQRCVPGF